MKTTFPSDPKEALTETVSALIQYTGKVTCVVYKRSQCIPCILNRLFDRFEAECHEEHKHWIEEEPEEYLRQVVIWSKEQTEAEMEKECSMDKIGELLGVNLFDEIEEMLREHLEDDH